MSILVTGGTGFLGTNLVRALSAAGESVRVLVRGTSPRAGLDLPGVEFVVGDVTDLTSMLSAVAGVDRVFHAAGWVVLAPWGRSIAHAVNVVGTRNVCEACLRSGVTRLVHTSSIAAVGHGPRHAPATEDTPWNLDFVGASYNRTKVEAERVVGEFVAKGLDAVIVNPGYVVGPYDVKPTAGKIILRTVTGRLPGYPSRGGVSFVDVREVVEGMLAAMERGRCGERYILANENLSHAEFVRKVARVAGVEAPRLSAPYWALYAPAAMATAAGRFVPRMFEDFNLCVLRAAFCETFVSAAKARRELGVRPRPIDTAIADALEWFEANGYVQKVGNGWRLLRRV